MIGALDEPTLVSGPDALAQMRFFKAQLNERVFFDDGYAYVDEDNRTIDVYRYNDGWKRLRSIAMPQGFGTREISRCGSHLVASVTDDNDTRFLASTRRGRSARIG